MWTLIPGVPIGCRSPRKRGPYSMPSYSHGIRAVHRPVPAPRHDAGHTVDEGKRHKPFARERFDIQPQRPKMMGIADGKEADSALSRELDRPREGPPQGRLGEPIAGIGFDNAAAVRNLDQGLHEAVDPAALERGDIAWQSKQAVALGRSRSEKTQVSARIWAFSSETRLFRNTSRTMSVSVEISIRAMIVSCAAIQEIR